LSVVASTLFQTDPDQAEDIALKDLLEKSAVSRPLDYADSMLDILFRVISIIPSALSTDQYQKTQDTALPDEDDLRHQYHGLLYDMFPTSSPQLRDRLVSASVDRRRFLQCTLNCCQKSKNNRSAKMFTSDAEPVKDIQYSRKADPVDADFSSEEEQLSLLDPFSQEQQVSSSETSSLDCSRMPKPSKIFSIPNFPTDSEHGLRECVACHLMLPLPTEKIWRYVQRS